MSVTFIATKILESIYSVHWGINPLKNITPLFFAKPSPL